MYQLSEDQIALIKREVIKQDIHLKHLATDLLDHLCCEIEEQIWQGKKFSEAYNNVMKIIGNEGLKQIQLDTLYLTDKKYRTMKNTVKIAGVVSMAMITTGSLFKIQHWPGANILFIVGFLILGGVYFPSSIMSFKKESTKPEPYLTYSSALIGGLAVIFATMLKVMHWPGANLLFLSGYILLGMVFIPLMLKELLKNAETSFLRLTYWIGAISLFMCLAGSLFKLNHYPGAIVFLFAGSIGLTTIFLPLYTYDISSRSPRIKPSYIFMSFGIVYFHLFNLLLSTR
jgi:uncharacterized membrane protein